MKFILLSVLLTLGLFASDAIRYRCYAKSHVEQAGRLLAPSGEIANRSRVTLTGEGKVIFFYPCGAPSIVKVAGTKSFVARHACEANSIAGALVTNFFHRWFDADEKIIISASSRSAAGIERGSDYFYIDNTHLKSIDLPVYDDDAAYRLLINRQAYDPAKLMDSVAIRIPLSLLGERGKNRVELYEDGIKVFDFSVEYIPQSTLREKYARTHLTPLEMALLYAQESQMKLYTNQDLEHLLRKEHP